MKAEKEFMFSPYIILGPVALVIFFSEPLYRMIKESTSFSDYWHFALIIAIILVTLIQILRIAILILKGVPAIRLTDDFLVISQKNLQIEWSDIVAIRTGGSKASYLAIAVDDPDKYIKRTLLRNIYVLISSIYPNEVSISLSIVKGDNDKIVAIIRKYGNLVDHQS